jgi:serine phosphatase RsbU (regulator of sigma subunit)
MMRKRETADNGDSVTFAFFGRPCSGERQSGDMAIVQRSHRTCFLAMVDVLGHGPEAHAVARQIDSFLRQNWRRDVVATLCGLHTAIQGTRGAAVGLCVLDEATGVAHYTAVGNTVLRVFHRKNGDARLSSTDGVVGENIRTPREQTLQLAAESTLVLYTDGIHDRFRREDYPQLVYESPWTVAKTLVERFRNKFDDATCIVLRWTP